MEQVFCVGIAIFIVIFFIILKVNKAKKSKLDKYSKTNDDITEQLDDITINLTSNDEIEFILEKNIVVTHAKTTIY